MKLSVLLLLGLLFVVGCTSSVEQETPIIPLPGEEGEEIKEMEVHEEEMHDHNGVMGRDVSFDIVMRQFEFEPNTIEVNKGDHVMLTLTSEDTEHGFGLPKFGINLKVPEGETATVDFVADEAGTFTFSCSVFCGSGHGSMKGVFVVNE